MNLLPLITAFILILSFGVQTIISKKLSSEKIELSMHGYMQAERAAKNAVEKKVYRHCQQKKIEANIHTSSLSQNLFQERKRKKKPKKEIPSSSKLNLWPLIQESKETHKDLYNTFVKLIEVIYKDAQFFQLKKISHLPSFIADQIISSAKKMQKNQNKNDLSNLSLDEKKLQPIYYKMLKGTKHYNFFEKKGYGSLLDFVKISNEKKEEKLTLAFASDEILYSFFNEKISQAIKKKEDLQKDGSFFPITKEELEEIFIQTNFSGNLSFLWKVLSFSLPTAKKGDVITVKGLDNKTNIEIKKTLHF